MRAHTHAPVHTAVRRARWEGAAVLSVHLHTLTSWTHTHTHTLRGAVCVCVSSDCSLTTTTRCFWTFRQFLRTSRNLFGGVCSVPTCRTRQCECEADAGLSWTLQAECYEPFGLQLLHLRRKLFPESVWAFQTLRERERRRKRKKKRQRKLLRLHLSCAAAVGEPDPAAGCRTQPPASFTSGISCPCTLKDPSTGSSAPWGELSVSLHQSPDTRQSNRLLHPHVPTACSDTRVLFIRVTFTFHKVKFYLYFYSSVFSHRWLL